MSLTTKVREDPVYIRSRRGLENLKKTIEVENILNELFSMHASRGVTALRPNVVLQSSVAVLLKSTTQEITVRSRATTIKMTVLRVLLKLDQTIDPLRKYILVTYQKEFKELGIGVTNQKNSTENILSPFLNFKRQLDSVLRIADLVIEDIDSAGWGLKRIQETIEQSSRDR